MPAKVYSAEHTAALVRSWIERGETPEQIEKALIEKINENNRALEVEVADLNRAPSAW